MDKRKFFTIVIPIVGFISVIAGFIAFITGKHSLSDYIPLEEDETKIEIKSTENNNQTISSTEEIDTFPVVRLNSVEYTISDIRLFHNIDDANNNINEAKSFSCNERSIILKFNADEIDLEYGTHFRCEVYYSGGGSEKESLYLEIDKPGEVIFSFSPQTWLTEPFEGFSPKTAYFSIKGLFVESPKGPNEGWHTIVIKNGGFSEEAGSIDFWIGDKN